MGRYVVKAPYVTVKVEGTVQGFYDGAPFEAEAGDVEHLLRKGMVEELKEPKPEPAREPSVKDILAEVGEDPEAATVALEAEQAKGDKARKSLVEGLEAIITAPSNSK